MPSYLVHDVDAIGTVADVLIDQREYLQLFRVDPTAPSTANPPALLTATTTFWLSTVARRFTTAGARVSSDARAAGGSCDPSPIRSRPGRRRSRRLCPDRPEPVRR